MKELPSESAVAEGHVGNVSGTAYADVFFDTDKRAPLFDNSVHAF